MGKLFKKAVNNSIPTQLTKKEFNEFILPHLSMGTRGPKISIPTHKVFNYILKLLYTGCQWKELPIDKDQNGDPEIHFTRIFKIYQRWAQNGSLEVSVRFNHLQKLFYMRYCGSSFL